MKNIFAKKRTASHEEKLNAMQTKSEGIIGALTTMVSELRVTNEDLIKLADESAGEAKRLDTIAKNAMAKAKANEETARRIEAIYC